MTATEIIKAARDVLYKAGELNMNNYDVSEVEALNSGATEAYLLLHDFVSEMKPKQNIRPKHWPYNSSVA